MFARGEFDVRLLSPVYDDPRDLVEIDGTSLSIEQVIRIARDRVQVSLTDSARLRIKTAREVVEHILAAGCPVYGLNTDLGPFAGQSLSGSVEPFQWRTVIGHALAHGEVLPTEYVRAMILTRINGIARGGSGVRLWIAEALVQLLNVGVHPIVRFDGSTGQSDLSEMAQVAGLLLGIGEAEYKGKRITAENALRAAGLTPIELQAKEGLALISANGVTLGSGAFVLSDVQALLQTFDVSAALALEAYDANLSIIHPEASRLKPHAGQQATARNLRRLLDKSDLFAKRQPRNLQDPLSFRCIPQVHGAARDVLDQVRSTLELELNSSSDNPLVSIEDSQIVSVGNFDVTGIAIGFDSLRVALIHVIQLAHERIQKQLWSHFSGLPIGLSENDDPLGRLIPLSRLSASILSESRRYASPVSLEYHSQLAEGIEDHASMAPHTVRATAQLVELARKIVAVELMVSARAIDLRRDGGAGAGLGRGTRIAHDLVATRPALTANVFNSELERIIQIIRNGRLLRMVTK